LAVVPSSFPDRLRVTMSAVLLSVISIGQNLLCSHLSSREDFSSLGGIIQSILRPSGAKLLKLNTL
jgi:hypothetical protein